MTLDRRQQQILRSYGTWPLTWILADPDGGISHAKSGGWGSSHHRVADETYRMETTAKGIVLHGRDGAADQVLAWAPIKAHALSLPTALRDQISDFRARFGKSQRDYPMFAATAEAAGCGMPWGWVHPITHAQALYADEWDAYKRDRLTPWQSERAALDAEREDLHDMALPLASASAEPVDLLDLLAAVS